MSESSKEERGGGSGDLENEIGIGELVERMENTTEENYAYLAQLTPDKRIAKIIEDLEADSSATALESIAYAQQYYAVLRDKLGITISPLELPEVEEHFRKKIVH